MNKVQMADGFSPGFGTDGPYPPTVQLEPWDVKPLPVAPSVPKAPQQSVRDMMKELHRLRRETTLLRAQVEMLTNGFTVSAVQVHPGQQLPPLEA